MEKRAVLTVENVGSNQMEAIIGEMNGICTKTESSRGAAAAGGEKKKTVSDEKQSKVVKRAEKKEKIQTGKFFIQESTWDSYRRP